MRVRASAVCGDDGCGDDPDTGLHVATGKPSQPITSVALPPIIPRTTMASTLASADSSAARHRIPRHDLVTARRADHEPIPPLRPRLVAEFIGTFFLVFTVCTATNPRTGAGALAPLAIGSVLMVMVFAGGHISGGHYNPAVSTAVLVRGKLGGKEWVSYVAIQLLSAIVAGLLGRAVNGPGHAAAVGGAWKILVVEFVFTFALAYVVLNVATTKATEGNSFYGLAIGFTVAAGAFAVGGVSGGAFNPAVALGASVLGILTWNRIWLYTIATLLGGVVAANAFLYLQPGESPSEETTGAHFKSIAAEANPRARSTHDDQLRSNTR
jgi:aquaporin Z